jgi:transcription elongation factor Elf1
MTKKGGPPFRGAIGAEHRGSSYNAADRREETPDVLPSSPPCPFCSGTETEIMNAFGAHASVSTYWCRACGSPFELMKWRRR